MLCLPKRLEKVTFSETLAGISTLTQWSPYFQIFLSICIISFVVFDVVYKKDKLNHPFASQKYMKDSAKDKIKYGFCFESLLFGCISRSSA